MRSRTTTDAPTRTAALISITPRVSVAVTTGKHDGSFWTETCQVGLSQGADFGLSATPENGGFWSYSASSGRTREVKIGTKTYRVRVAPGHYADGNLITPERLPYPEIHSCVWLWPDGRVRNYGYNVPEWDEEPSPPFEAKSEKKPLPETTPDLRYCGKCQRWAARVACHICGEATTARGAELATAA
jgi:hypothetical protein